MEFFDVKIDNYIKKIKKNIYMQITEEKYEQAMISIKMLAQIYYNYNQIYYDSDLEDALLKIRDAVLVREEYTKDKKCVLFYDGFGLDLRGLAASYVRALSSLEYFVIYVCPISSKGKIPHIIAELDENNSKVIYLNTALNSIDIAKKIDSVFKVYKPTVAFFYTTPHDVSAAIAFSNNDSSIRFQIDLTDHAYWIGTNAFDYITESREMGASIAIFERKIDIGKVIKLDCVPYINQDKYEVSLPFDIHKDKYIFTGGSLYKTLGDKELLYYKTIANIMENFSDIKFLYAGSGDDSEMKKIISKFPGRAYLIDERPDFFRLIENCILYINSYPMFGGLMMRYAAMAHKVPITLRHDNDADGILFNQSKLGIEFDNYQDYISEIHKLLSDDNYRKNKEELVDNSVLNELRFARNLKSLIEEQRTEFQFKEIKKFDTSEFRKEYKRRFKKKTIYKIIGQKGNVLIAKYFPIEFALGAIIKIKEKLVK